MFGQIHINIKLYKIQALHLLHACGCKPSTSIADTFTMKMHSKILADMETKSRRTLFEEHCDWWIMTQSLRLMTLIWKHEHMVLECVAAISCEVCSENEEQDSAVQQGQQSVWVAPWPRVGGIP